MDWKAITPILAVVVALVATVPSLSAMAAERSRLRRMERLATIGEKLPADSEALRDVRYLQDAVARDLRADWSPRLLPTDVENVVLVERPTRIPRFFSTRAGGWLVLIEVAIAISGTVFPHARSLLILGGIISLLGLVYYVIAMIRDGQTGVVVRLPRPPRPTRRVVAADQETPG